MSFFKWSKTAANNATADGSINWAEGQAPSTVNDSARAMMAAAAKFRDDIGCNLSTSGTGAAYTLATNQVFDTLANLNGKLLSCLVHTANSAGCTLNVDGLGAFKLRNISGTDLSANQLYGNARVFFTFDNANSQFILLSLPGGILDAPAGTAMIFQQSSAPAGWTKASTHNDKALRVVTGSAGSGGSNSFSGQFVNPFSLGSVTILQANLPSGNVGGATTGISVSAITGLLGGGGSGFAAGAQGGSAINFSDPGHTHALGGSDVPLSLGSINLALAYVDVIIATKN
jgi:hypothetical protein